MSTTTFATRDEAIQVVRTEDQLIAAQREASAHYEASPESDSAKRDYDRTSRALIEYRRNR